MTSKEDPDRCAAEGCERSSHEQGGALGLCAMHYQRQKRTGSLERSLPEGDFVQVVFRVPKAQHARLTSMATKRKTTLADILRQAVMYFLRGSK